MPSARSTLLTTFAKVSSPPAGRGASIAPAQASYLALPTADRARIEEFVGDPSTAVKRTYKRRR